jgi:hypothetical protein
MLNVGDIVKYNDYEIILYGTIIEVIPKKNKHFYRVMWFTTGNTYEYKDFALMRVYND